MPKPAYLLSALLAVAGLTAAPANAAQVYKWTDEKGVVHYSESPPPDSAKNSGTVKLSTHVPEDAAQAQEARQKSLAEQRKAKEGAPAATPAASAPAAADSRYKERCAQWRSSLQTMTEHGRIRMTDKETGEVRVLTDQEKQNQMDEARRQIKAFCE